jgi:argininosuccinate lyase
MKQTSQRTWGGRFSTGPAEAVKKFTESVSFDWRLYKHDIAGSVAHAKGLAKAGIITKAEAGKIAKGLKAIEREIEAGKFQWNADLEDVHMNIETALVKKIGAAGKKLHTARSRNDQVATDLKLWVRDNAVEATEAVNGLTKALVELAERNCEVVIPGYTHTQRAQPVLLAHHLLAYVEMFRRDYYRFAWTLDATSRCPLGSGAIAGSTIALNREFVAEQIGCCDVTRNSMDAVSDRDFVLDFLYATAVTGMHLSRLAEDLILWSTAEFGFVTIGDAYTTGSSLMPQKKNPDICELVRGKTGRLYGNLVAVLTMMKGLPMTYNRDMQEDKEPLFDSADTLLASLNVMADMLRHTKVNKARCEAAASDPMLLATDLVDFLVKKGMPFREAHHAVGALVAESEKTGMSLPKVAGKKYGRAAEKVFDVRRALEARKAIGAPSPKNVRSQISRWKLALKGVAVAAAFCGLAGMTNAQTNATPNAQPVGHQLSFAMVGGNPAIAFNDITQGGLKFVRAAGVNGENWGAPLTVDASAAAGTSISMAAVLNNPAIAYQDGSQLKYVRADDWTGNNWFAPVVVDTNGVIASTVALSEVNYYPSIAYGDAASGALKYVQANDCNGVAWRPSVFVDTKARVGLYPSLTTINESPAIAYFDSAAGVLKYIRASNSLGSRWRSPIRVSTTPGSGAGPSLLIAGFNPAISYYSLTEKVVRYVLAEDSLGNSWRASVGIVPAQTGRTSMSIINNNPAIAYCDRIDNSLKFVRAGDSLGINWGRPVVLDTNAQAAADVTMTVVNGRAAIAYWWKPVNGPAQIRFIIANDYNGQNWPAPITVWSAGQ